MKTLSSMYAVSCVGMMALTHSSTFSHTLLKKFYKSQINSDKFSKI